MWPMSSSRLNNLIQQRNESRYRICRSCTCIHIIFFFFSVRKTLFLQPDAPNYILCSANNIMSCTIWVNVSIVWFALLQFSRLYSGTSPYGHLTSNGHLTSKTTSPFQSPWLSPKLYSTVQITPCNKVTSPLRSLLPSPVGDLNSEVPL